MALKDQTTTHVWPNLTLTGEDIHRAYFNVCPEGASKQWDDVEEVAKEMYRNMAKELNRELNARQAWFEADTVTISSIRCPQCCEMLEAEHAEKHACWIAH